MKRQKFDPKGYNNLCSKTVSSLFAHTFSNSRKNDEFIHRSSNSRVQDRIAKYVECRCAKPAPPATNALYNSPKGASDYGVSVSTTVCTALVVPFTALCATFLAVFAVLFATFLAVRTGPA
jgi:hypothetical protein